MNASFRAELFKERSIQTGIGMLGGMIVLVIFVSLLHATSLPSDDIATASDQLNGIFSWGQVFGMLFAAILGTMSFTGEIHHGTIRPTLLVTPRRNRLVIAKVWACLLIGTGYGLAAATVALGAGIGGLTARGIDVRLDAVDYITFVVGSTAAAGLAAAIGVGLGAIVRGQVPTLIGICVWLILIENLLLGDITGFGESGQFLPGAAGKAMSGQDPNTYLSPAAGFIVLALYATVATVVGSIATERRDFE